MLKHLKLDTIKNNLISEHKRQNQTHDISLFS